jgi:23S rRNA pseudouridine1911/1915/1917 synthase
MTDPDAHRPGRHWVVMSEESPRRLDAFLAGAERLGSRRRATRALERGQVFVNHREATSADAALRVAQGDRVVLWLDRPGSARRRTRTTGSRVPIVFEDDRLIVVNKPPGMLTVPLPRRADVPSVADHLREHLRSKGKRRPLIVHRIDRDTSGLVVFATRPDAHQVLKEQFRRHEPERVYLAIVKGTPVPSVGSWRDRLVWDQARLRQTSTHARDARGQEGLCHYRVIEAFADASLLEVRLVTGMRNQIRLQAGLRGHTLLGERQYIGHARAPLGLSCPRQALHASSLSFRHPASGETLAFEAPLPADMVELLQALRTCQSHSRPERTTSANLQGRP